MKGFSEFYKMEHVSLYVQQEHQLITGSNALNLVMLLLITMDSCNATIQQLQIRMEMVVTQVVRSHRDGLALHLSQTCQASIASSLTILKSEDYL